MSSAFGAAVNLAKLCVGVGLLALPFATGLSSCFLLFSSLSALRCVYFPPSSAHGGLFFSPIAMGIVAVWNWIACSMMIRCKAACTTLTFPPGLNSTYSKIAFAGGGWPAVFAIDLSILVTLLGVCVSYQITCADLIGAIPGVTLSHSTLSVLSAVIVFPVCMAKDVGGLSSFSLAGLACILAGVSVILYHGLTSFGTDVINRTSILVPVPLWPNNLSDMTTYLGISFFCFGICSLAFPVEESLRDRNDFGKALTWSLTFCWILYMFVGDIVAILYSHDPNGISQNILGNLPPASYISSSVRVAMAAVCLLTYPITILPAGQIIEQMVLHRWQGSGCNGGSRGSNRTISLLNKSSTAYEPISDDVMFESNSNAYASTATASAPASAGPNRNTISTKDASPQLEASLMLRCTNRFLLMVFCTVLSTTIPCFGVVVSLTGSFTVAILSFIMPAYLHLQLVSLPRYFKHNPHVADSTLLGRIRRFSSVNEDLNNWNHEELAPPTRFYLDVALVVSGLFFSAVGTYYTAYKAYVSISSGATC